MQWRDQDYLRECKLATSTLSKRLFDLGIAVPAAIVAFPVCLVLLVLIRLESPGPPLFVQWRVGRHQRPFRIFKLRTMAMNVGDRPSHEAEASGITRLGRILRRLKLDELPQLLNVLAGSMSLVGPRPCLPSQTELIAARAARSLFDFPPGVTGPAQLRNVDMSTPVLLAEIERDYFPNASLRSDVNIIVRTFLGGGSGDAAPGGED